MPFGDACVAYGDEGSFCGVPCGELDFGGDECPAGYECHAGQCVAQAGACRCAPYHIEQQATTICQVTNEFGSCPGMRICTGKGLTECDAPTPEPEAYDGVDNDCDGQTDERGE